MNSRGIDRTGFPRIISRMPTQRESVFWQAFLITAIVLAALLSVFLYRAWLDEFDAPRPSERVPTGK